MMASRSGRAAVFLLLSGVVHGFSGSQTAPRRGAPRHSEPEGGFSRRTLIRTGSAAAYGTLLVGIATAESSPLYQGAVRAAINGAVPGPGLNALEIGIGVAPNLDRYPRGTTLVGLDAKLQDDESLKFDEMRARAKGVRLIWQEGDAAKMPFKDAVFAPITA